ncbi:MAG TPA: dihydrolipoamide acetyltransferase family protein [Acidimicrobiia bacterium]|nr:dihydrolipoamide acetyltransferase family protein [Acidimicrobiia bacterium]
MATTVTMPQLGETVTEGTILRWAKKVGEQIQSDEVLVEISTDKVDTEIPSPAQGVVLELLVGEGETVSVGTPLAVIGEAGEGGATDQAPATQSGEPAPPPQPATTPPPEPAAAPAPPAAPAPSPAPVPPPEPAPAPQPAPAPEPGPQSEAQPEAETASPKEIAVTVEQPQAGAAAPSRAVLSPVVRKLVRDQGVDLEAVTGTGEGGRITRRDVESYISAREAGTARPATVTAARAAAPTAAPPGEMPRPTAPTARPAPEAPAPMAPPEPVAGPGGAEEAPLDRLRVRIGENMIRAKQTAAHVWTSMEVDYERVERVRSAAQPKWKEDEGFSLTYLPFIARATIDALQEFPVVNSAFLLEEKKSITYRSVNLGIAIDLNQKGLIVATIRNADGLRLVGLARKIRELAEKARAGKLDPDDVSGSTFSITNPGPYGSFMSAPIINVPNVGILSTDTVAKRPAVVTTPEGQDTIAVRHVGYLGLSWDHRAFDGSTAVLFLARIKKNLETWDWNQELA